MRHVLLLGMLGACALDGPQTRSRVDDEPPGETCVEGGLVVRTGLDADEDKYVDDDEITGETYLCRFESERTCEGPGKVLHGRVTLATTEDEDKIDGVTCIEGDLVIASNTAFELLGTSQLHTVIGHVAIAGNPSLQTLDGLDSLRAVSGEVLIQGNDGLVDLAPLGKLVRGDLTIVSNDFMTDLHGLQEMTTAPGTITVAGNPELISLRGLDGLTTSSFTISIRGNPQLASIEALRGLETAGNLTIADNADLSSIELPALSAVDGQLAIESNRGLRAISLPALSRVKSSLIVDTNAGIGELALPSLRSVGRLMVRDNERLAGVRVPVLDEVTGGIELAGSPVLMLVDAGALGFIEGFLKLDGVGLADLTGFATVYEVGRLELAGLPRLATFDGLGALAVIDGDFRVTDNAELRSFDGLDGLASVEGNFVVRGSSELKKAARAFAERIEIRGAVGID